MVTVMFLFFELNLSSGHVTEGRRLLSAAKETHIQNNSSLPRYLFDHSYDDMPVTRLLYINCITMTF